jgi:GLPGLI family protein
MSYIKGLNKMKIYASLYFLSFHLCTINAQIKFRDTSSLEIFYEFNFVPDSSLPEIKNGDVLVLEIGKISSSCFSLYNKKRQEAFLQDLSMQSAHSEKIVINPDIIKLPTGLQQIFCKIPDQKHTIVFDNVYGFQCYYIDTLNSFQWKIMSDTITILGYVCQKATANFRGRNWIAWFTTALPYDNGPLKFGGLPGLILKLEDIKNNFNFIATTIQKPKETPIIIIDKKGYSKFKRNEIRDMHKKADEDPIGFATTINPNFHVNENPHFTNRQKKRYNPIELE